MSKCISDSSKECINSSCGTLRWCAEVASKTVDSTPPTEHTSGSNDAKTEVTTVCTCEVCELGLPMPMHEWLASDPRHPKIHERIMAALARGEIQVKGEANENASRVDASTVED